MGFIKVGAFQSFNAVSLGHMISCMFDAEQTSITCAFFLMQMIACGAGHNFSKKTNNLVGAVVTKISPMSYSLELYLRKSMSKVPASGLILGMFGFTTGEEQSYNFLVVQGLVFLMIGWVSLTYKCKYVY